MTKTLEQHALSRKAMARRLAMDLKDDWVVNVGIGMPTSVIPYVPEERDVIFHSENGIIGMGPELADGAEVDFDLLSAGKRPVSLVLGGAFVHHADSFALARGGRLDLTILGAYQVAANGDLANWKLPGARAGNIGGAMDLAVGARRVFVLMTHVAQKGEPKLVKTLTYPATAKAVVTKVFTDLAVISVDARGFVLEEIVDGLTPEDIQKVTDAPLHSARDIKIIARS